MIDYEKACAGTRALMSPEGESKRCTEQPCCNTHLRWMLDQVLSFAKEGKHPKANRWLGYVQGVLSARGAPLEKLKDINRSGETMGVDLDPDRRQVRRAFLELEEALVERMLELVKENKEVLKHYRRNDLEGMVEEVCRALETELKKE